MLVSEQLTFNGPRQYQVDGTMIHETISILRETEQVAIIGTNIAGTLITYRGPDKRFGNAKNEASGLKTADIGPVLREWGYDYQVDNTNHMPGR